MSIYLVYCARHSTDKNGLPMPQADLQISLPEQAQYRFAGYVQAVIERYAEELEALDEEDEGSGSDANSDDKGGERVKKKRRRQPKVVQEDEEDPLGSCFYRDCLVSILTMFRRCSTRRPCPCDQRLRIPSHSFPLYPRYPNHDHLLQPFYDHLYALRTFTAHV